MNLAPTLLLITLLVTQFEPPVTVRCQLDTELPLEEIRVSIAEMREREGMPEGDGAITLSGLPSGDIHLTFFQGEVALGEIEIRSANDGEFIRLKVRLVTGNAILLDEFRVKGVSGDGSEPRKGTFSAATVSEPTRVVEQNTQRPPPQASRPSSPVTRPPKRSSSKCPTPGDAITRTGKLSRIIDNDSFELTGSDRRDYVVYVGSATRMKRGSSLVANSALREGLGILVKGTVAAGPEDECSIGAREVIVQRE